MMLRLSADAIAKLIGELLRGVSFWIGEVAIVLMLGLPSLIAIALDPGDRAIHWFQQLWGRLTLAWLRVLGVVVVFEGLEHLPRGGSSILAANHASLLDIFAVSAIQPPHTRWVVKSGLRNLPIVGWAIRLVGFIFVDRKGCPDSIRASFEDTERTLSRSGRAMNLLFFPEGTRTRDGNLLPFERGAFLMAVEWKLSIVPIAIDGTFSILRRGWFAPLRRGTSRVIILVPITPEDSPSWSEETLMQRTRARIAEALTTSARELPAIPRDEDPFLARLPP